MDSSLHLPPHRIDMGSSSFSELICPDLGVVPSGVAGIDTVDIPAEMAMTAEKYCKRGFLSNIKQIGYKMLHSWYASTSKQGIKKAYSEFKRDAAKLFLNNCNNLTKLHQAVEDIANSDAAIERFSDMEKEMYKSYLWKFYLVLTDSVMKHWFPESEVYGEDQWASANSFMKDNVIKGEVNNYFNNLESTSEQP